MRRSTYNLNRVRSGPRSSGRGYAYDRLVRSLGPLMWLRFEAQSGTKVRNHGSLGLDGVWTPGTGAVAQNGYFGPNSAFSFDGSDSRVQIPASAALGTRLTAVTTFTIFVLARPTNAGEINFGRFFTSNRGIFNFGQFNGSLNAITAAVDTDGTDAQSVTTTGVAANNWLYFIFTYNNAGDRKIRIYNSLAGVTAEYAYSSQVAATGNVRTVQATDPFAAGNSNDQALTFNGLYSDLIIVPKVLPVAVMSKVSKLAAEKAA